MNKDRGILLLAMDSPYYGSWAWNLAAGIKSANPDTRVALAYKGDSLRFIQQVRHLFNDIIEIPDHCVNRNGFNSYLRAKTCLYELSPYKETIYIDADVIWFYNKDINALWEEVNKFDFSMGCRGINDLDADPRMIWCKAQDLRIHGENTVYNLSSEFIYFKKTEKVKSFFDLSQKFFDNPGVEYNLFGGTVPDELAFQISMMKCDIRPHKDFFLPFYWEPFHKKNLNAPEIYSKDWFGYSIGGNQINPTQKNIYDSLAKLYAKQFGARYSFLSYSKKEVLKHREKI